MKLYYPRAFVVYQYNYNMEHPCHPYCDDCMLHFEESHVSCETIVWLNWCKQLTLEKISVTCWLYVSLHKDVVFHYRISGLIMIVHSCELSSYRAAQPFRSVQHSKDNAFTKLLSGGSSFLIRHSSPKICTDL